MGQVRTKFGAILAKNAQSITETRAARLEKTTLRAAEKTIMNLEDEISSLEDQMEAMLDISASADKNVDNRLSNFDGDDFFNRYIALKESVEMKQIELRIAIKAKEELFSDITKTEEDVTTT